MEDSLNELVVWIKKLQARCFEFNAALIKAYDLDNKPELEDWNRFSRPSRAVVLKLIPRRATIYYPEKATLITYYVHGSGITFETADKEFIQFDYFPQPDSSPKPLLGIWELEQFISSIDPVSRLCDNQLLERKLKELFQAGIAIRVYEEHSLTFYLK